MLGALVNDLGAIALGASVGTQYFSKTINWSLMMSLFTIVLAASIFGVSWKDWQRIFAHIKAGWGGSAGASGSTHPYWPMPLNWERPWQEWPICVSYGAIAGYLLAMVASVCFVLARATLQHVKRD